EAAIPLRRQVDPAQRLDGVAGAAGVPVDGVSAEAGADRLEDQLDLFARLRAALQGLPEALQNVPRGFTNPAVRGACRRDPDFFLAWELHPHLPILSRSPTETVPAPRRRLCSAVGARRFVCLQLSQVAHQLLEAGVGAEGRQVVVIFHPVVPEAAQQGLR